MTRPGSLGAWLREQRRARGCDASMNVLIPGIPDDDEHNRANAARLGFDWTGWPVPPPGSVPAVCASCGGAMLLDPGSEQLRQGVIAEGFTPVIACIVCAVAVYGAYGPPPGGPG